MRSEKYATSKPWFLSCINDYSVFPFNLLSNLVMLLLNIPTFTYIVVYSYL